MIYRCHIDLYVLCVCVCVAELSVETECCLNTLVAM